MIKVAFSKLFLKDLKKLKNVNQYSKIKEFCFEEVEKYNYDSSSCFKTKKLLMEKSI
jgi:mRNA-degrading endonuclease RelE of RelBE toxin-antitoxin system